MEGGQGRPVWADLPRRSGAWHAPSPEVPALLPGRVAPHSPQPQLRHKCCWVGTFGEDRSQHLGLYYQMVPHLGLWVGKCSPDPRHEAGWCCPWKQPTGPPRGLSGCQGCEGTTSFGDSESPFLVLRGLGSPSLCVHQALGQSDFCSCGNPESRSLVKILLLP